MTRKGERDEYGRGDSVGSRRQSETKTGDGDRSGRGRQGRETGERWKRNRVTGEGEKELEGEGDTRREGRQGRKREM